MNCIDKKIAQEILDVLIKYGLSVAEATDMLNYVNGSLWKIAVIPDSAKVPEQ